LEKKREAGNAGASSASFVSLTVTMARLLSGEQRPGTRLGALCEVFGVGEEWCEGRE
jgi:hypothetical protein